MNRHTLMKQLVIEEATNLKKHATQEELNKLDFSILHPNKTDRCIYGQLAESCFSHRAVDLMKTCASRGYETNSSFEIYDCKINGPIKELDRRSFWSPIEVFIDQPRNQENGNNKILIDFLKGEIDELKFK